MCAATDHRRTAKNHCRIGAYTDAAIFLLI